MTITKGKRWKKKNLKNIQKRLDKPPTPCYNKVRKRKENTVWQDGQQLKANRQEVTIMLRTNSNLFGTADAIQKMLKDGRKHLQHIDYYKSNIRDTKVVVVNLYYSTAIEQFSITYEEAIKLHDHTRIIDDDFVVEIAAELAADKEVEEEVEYNMTEADYDDAEELRLIAEYNKIHADGFKSCVNSISEAANEGLNNVFGYVSEALDNLITAVQNISDPYLNMMYADEDFEAFVNYDPADDYFVDDMYDCYAA